MPAYEYAVLFYTLETNWNEIRDLPVGTRPKQTWTHLYHLWRPGAEDAENLGAEVKFVNILNNLGREGWRMVDSTVLDTVVTTPGRNGWSESGIPVHMRWTFMREAQP